MTGDYDPPGARGSEPQTPGLDFVDIHVKLDGVIRVHGTTDEDRAEEIATAYLADDLRRSAMVAAHRAGVLCDDDEEWAVLDENGNLTEDQLSVALYPDDREVPTGVLVRVVESYPVAQS